MEAEGLTCPEPPVTQERRRSSEPETASSPASPSHKLPQGPVQDASSPAPLERRDSCPSPRRAATSASIAATAAPAAQKEQEKEAISSPQAETSDDAAAPGGNGETPREGSQPLAGANAEAEAPLETQLQSAALGAEAAKGATSEEGTTAEVKEGTTCSEIPRVRGRQAWRAKGSVRSFGKFCKEASNRNRGSWESRQRAREEARAMQRAEAEMREARAAARRRRRERTEEKKRRKQENEMKSAHVQVIKDTTKLRKWSKKARRALVKMSPEMIKKLYNVNL